MIFKLGFKSSLRFLEWYACNLSLVLSLVFSLSLKISKQSGSSSRVWVVFSSIFLGLLSILDLNPDFCLWLQVFSQKESVQN